MRRPFALGCGALALAGLGIATVAAMIVLALSSTDSAAEPVSVSRCQLQPVDGGLSVDQVDDEQLKHARLIIAIGKAQGVPPRGWVVAIATAMQESTLRNLDYGDRDSLGLMQQRPSAGWGTRAQVQDPEHAVKAFYGGPNSPVDNTGLLDVPGWQNMSIWRAAQTVQRSAFPYAYQVHEPLASDLVEQIADTSAGCENIATGFWTLPVDDGYELTFRYGPRTSPTRGGSELHTGLDFSATTGTPVRAVAAGRVSVAGDGGSYGSLVKIRHENGVETYYAHLSATTVSVGQRVQPGDEVGAVGSSGNSTGSHLHLEVRVDGQPTNPETWLRQKGVTP